MADKSNRVDIPYIYRRAKRILPTPFKWKYTLLIGLLMKSFSDRHQSLL